MDPSTRGVGVIVHHAITNEFMINHTFRTILSQENHSVKSEIMMVDEKIPPSLSTERSRGK